MIKPTVAIGALLAMSLLHGCATEGTSIPIGDAKNYPPTASEQISLLVAPPSRPHEIIALVDGMASTDDYLSVSRTQAAAIDAMKKEAARLGANAIVITAKGSSPYAQVTTTSGTGSANVVGVGNTAIGSGFFNATSTTMGWEKITISGSAIRYME